MSRAKSYTYGGVEFWFDYKNPMATVEQIELVSDITGTPIDDLLDAAISQREAARRLFEMDGLIPEHVLENRRRRLMDAKHAPACRWCSISGERCEGMITRHHYVPRWLMLLLENYEAYAPRSFCTIPICLGRHRDLHMRGGPSKSIAECLTDHERKFAQKMLDELREQHPSIFDLMASGDGNAYEGQLIRDYLAGAFRTAEDRSEAISINDRWTPWSPQAVAVASG